MARRLFGRQKADARDVYKRQAVKNFAEIEECIFEYIFLIMMGFSY